MTRALGALRFWMRRAGVRKGVVGVEARQARVCEGGAHARTHAARPRHTP